LGVDFKKKWSIILQLVYPLVSRIRARWIWSRGERYHIYGKLDPAKIAWVIREKEKGQLTNRVIAERMGISQVWVKKLWRRYKIEQKVPELGKPGRKPGPGTSEQEEAIILKAREEYKVCAFILERVIDIVYFTHIPHNRIHEVLKGMGLVRNEPKKQKQRKWIKYERKYSNSLWHTDWKLLEGYGWLIAFEDDASRKVVGYAVFTEATSEHAVEVLEKAIKKWGRPASVLSDRGSQFYAVESEERVRGVTAFEMTLAKHEIRQVLGRVHHPQTNGKVERFFRTAGEKIQKFRSVDELVLWYNSKRPHMSLNLDAIETPDQAFIRKMPEEGIVIDEESGEIYHAQSA